MITRAYEFSRRKKENYSMEEEKEWYSSQEAAYCDSCPLLGFCVRGSWRCCFRPAFQVARKHVNFCLYCARLSLERKPSTIQTDHFSNTGWRACSPSNSHFPSPDRPSP